MPQFRKDPFGSAWVIISPERGLLPSDFGSAEQERAPCALCPGYERGREIRALRPSARAAQGDADGAVWQARVSENPAALLAPGAFRSGGDGLFSSAPGVGYQELITEHPQHDMRLEKMPQAHLVDLLKLYRDRIAHLSQKPDIKHVQLSRNVGRSAGAAYGHPHAQVLALPVTNRWVDEEHAAAARHFGVHGRCLFCDVVEAEFAERSRLISSNAHFVALAPYASKTPFETWLLPRAHSATFASLPSNALPHLADLLQSVISAMNTALNDPPYNMILHALPVQSGSYHWHIEILPRLTAHSGFDWGSGFYVNPTPPEDAARFLKEALALQGTLEV